VRKFAFKSKLNGLVCPVKYAGALDVTAPCTKSPFCREVVDPCPTCKPVTEARVAAP
jgi:hypothetical protein